MPSRRLLRSHGTILLIVAYVALTFEHSPIGGRLVEAAVLILFSCGSAILSFQQWFSGLRSQSPLEHSTTEKSVTKIDASPRRWNVVSQAMANWRSISPSAKREVVTPLAIAAALRVILFRTAASESGCIVSSLYSYLPLIIALHTFVRPQKAAEHDDRRLAKDDDEWGMASPLERASPTPSIYLLCSLSLAATMLLKLWVTPPAVNTHICPRDVISRLMYVTNPLVALFVDFYIITKLESLVKGLATTEAEHLQFGNAVAAACILSSEILAVVGGLNMIIQPSLWQTFLSLDRSYVASLFGYVCMSLWFLNSSASVITETNVFHFAFSTSALILVIKAYKQTLLSNDLIQSVPAWRVALFLAALYTAVELYARLSTAFGLLSSTRSSRPSTRLYTTLISIALAVFAPWCWLSWPRQGYYGYHPLDDIIDNGMIRSQKWLSQASQGMSLDVSIENYNRRHGRPPPPGYDNWYRYATQRSSYIIDDFDSLYDDLKPFWGIAPFEIRRATEEATSLSGSGIARIEVRNGQAKLASGGDSESDWFVNGFMSMTSQFIKHIPDMDLALNLHDYPRIAVPQSKIRDVLTIASQATTSKDTNFKWSENRADSWKREGLGKAPGLFGKTNSADMFRSSTIGCPSSSPARRYHDWDPTASCSSCTLHTTAGIVSNWTLAQSPCHQPDLRNLHGFFMGSSDTQISHKLLPILSQSKVAGFADILIPSPWDYLNKTPYVPDTTGSPDVPFAKKRDSLFWRGTTNEGTSHSGLWKGMLRQRLVHIASKLPLKSHNPRMPILLPDYQTESRFSVQYPEFSYKHVFPTLNISFSGIDHATGSDHAAQVAHFGISPHVIFEEHWRHRYLFVTDGAGMSHDFIPFMQSRSLPFRSGIFKAWYDGRLTAWAHFVPIDVRLTGLFSTLAYFAGTDGVREAKTLKARVGMEKKLKVAESIAENGRDWAQKVLRKEDMEIYLFRLLLEWGRITDDKRDELGLVV